MSKRAIRRSHYLRLKKKQLKRLKNDWYSINHLNEEQLNANAAFLVNTPKRCSCSMCCNRRSDKWLPKKERLSIQERKELINEKEQINGQ